MCYRAYGTYRIKCMTLRAPRMGGNENILL